MKRIHRNAVAALVLLVALGCAGAKVKPGQRYAEDEALPEPPVLIVYDFAVSPEEAVQDHLGSEYSPSPDPPSKELKHARQVAATLSDQLVKKLNKRGIHAERSDDATPPPMNAMVLKGQFVSIDKGSRIARMVIGFGAGASKLRVNVQAYQATEYGLRRIAEAEGETKGSKMPGMAVPMAGGAAMGTLATSAVISGGMNIVQEVQGRMTADAGRLADAIAKRAAAFYKRQGWL